jgi:membrane protease YdiL (CAAX protease family)
LKDAARLLVYFVATVLLGALLAPVLFWSAQSLAAHGVLPVLARFDFESVFHRALLVSAVALLWPLLRSVRVRAMRDLELAPNPNRWRDVSAGFLFSAVPLLCCGAILIVLHIFSVRFALTWNGALKIIGASIVVPMIEEVFFRGLVLGVLLRSGRRYMSIFVTSALYSIVHFLKAPEGTSAIVTWTSGFHSIAGSFSELVLPMYPLFFAASFTTLFLIGWILADARIATRSLWLPGGLHAGWILANGLFNKTAHREIILFPWLGKNLLVGIVPLTVACLTWMLVRGWLRYVGARKS